MVSHKSGRESAPSKVSKLKANFLGFFPSTLFCIFLIEPTYLSTLRKPFEDITLTPSLPRCSIFREEWIKHFRCTINISVSPMVILAIQTPTSS